jgi:hypothetical protein
MQSVERKRIYLETYAIQLRMQSNRIKSVHSNNRCIRLIFNHFKELFALFSGRLWEKVYKVKTRFVFEGVFEVKASSRVEARQMVQDNCGMVLHSGIQTTLEDDVIDWNFSCHPDKKIVSVVK